MSRLIESIKLMDGVYFNLPYHQERMRRSVSLLYGIDYTFDIENYLTGVQHPRNGLYKCRIVYDHVSTDVSINAYQARKIRRIKIIEDDSISYEYKFLDRQHIDRLFQRRGDCDDILVLKDGRVTDCSFSNIVFRKGGEWFTPSSPLLAGTMRQKLIDENKIAVREIRREDIRSFDTFKIINAMLEFSSPEIEVSEIVF